MILAKISVSGVQAEVTQLQDIPKGIVGGQIQLEYTDAAWEDLTKTVVFYTRWITKDVVNPGKIADIPSEVVSRSGEMLYVGIYGTDGEDMVAIPTVWAPLGVIRGAADPSGDVSTDPTLSVWAQLQEQIDDLKENSTGTEGSGSGGNADISGLVNRAESAASTAQSAASSAFGAKIAADQARESAQTAASAAQGSANSATSSAATARMQASSAGSSATKASESATKAEEAAVRAEEAAANIGNVDKLVLTSLDGTEWNITVSDAGVITATKVGGNGEDEEVMVFTPFKFIQVSDTHYQYSQDATAVLVANINALSDADFVTTSGDLTLENPASDEVKAAELAEYKANLRDLLDIPIYTCHGNHDNCKNRPSMWLEYTGVELLHEMVHKNCVFLFMDYLSTGCLDWLEEKVATHTGKRIFVYEHIPIETDEFTVGLKEGETRGTFGDADMIRVLRLLRNNHNVIWFTGHTHWAFGTAVNDVYNDNGLMGTIVHTPYLNAYQGWEVNVNDDVTILKGVAFGASGMTYLGNGYDYTIEQDITDYGESEILTDGGTVGVGGEADISVYLATAPKNNQTVTVEAKEGISVNVASLTFTPQNYNVPQTVTVTGNSVGIGRLVLYSNSKTTVRKVDVVAGSATVNYFNKNKPLTPLGVYYGTGSSGSYQMSNLIPANTGDHVLSNALGSQTSMRLKMFDADFKYIAEAQNQVASINYVISEANVKYVSVVYRGATAGQADTIMVTVNQALPSEYVAYNAEPIGYVLTNYADPDNPVLTNGYYNSSFEETDATGQSVSNLIPCVSGDVVYSNNNAATNCYVYLYDATQAMIGRIAWSNKGATIENENAACFAVGYKNSATDLMIMKNQQIPGYYVADTDTM